MTGWMERLPPLLEWIGQHPHWAGAVVALVAFAESLALVGLFVPGAALMFAAGAVIGSGQLELGPMILWAAAGAIAGDGVSFWLGWYYRDRLRGFWPFRNYPAALARGEAYFRRHGGKSVVIGRFVGPVRPIIPAVAGMLGMPVARFLAANVASALVWAPAYLLPGMVFAASLSLAAEVAGRLVALLLLLVAAVWALVWALRRAERPLRFGGQRVARSVGRRPPGGLAAPLLRPGHAALRALRHRPGWLWWLALGVLAAVLLRVALAPAPAGWERAALAVADAYRTPAVREAFWMLTQLGGTLPVGVALLAAAALLLRARHAAAALWLVAAVGGARLIGYGLKLGFAVPRPGGLTATEAFTYAFPSGHAGGTAALVTAILAVAAPAGGRGRRLAFLAGGVLVVAVAVSRVALGVHWPLDIVAGGALGIVVGALPALRSGPGLPARLRRQVLAAAAAALAATAAVTTVSGWPDPLAHYPGETRVVRLDARDWWQGAAALPALRSGLGEAAGAFDAHWLGGGDGPAGFDAAPGWQVPEPWDWRGALLWLSPRPDAGRLPPLPQWHDGRLPAAVRVRPEAEGSRLVLRAWRGAETSEGPLWLLTLERERLAEGPLVVTVRSAPVDLAARREALQQAADRAGYRLRPGTVWQARPGE